MVMPPTGQILDIIGQSDILRSSNYHTRFMDIIDRDMDKDMDINLDAGKLEVEKYGYMSRKLLLCPICESECPSRRFSEFPLIKKDLSPIPLPFQDISIPPPPKIQN